MDSFTNMHFPDQCTLPLVSLFHCHLHADQMSDGQSLLLLISSHFEKVQHCQIHCRNEQFTTTLPLHPTRCFPRKPSRNCTDHSNGNLTIFCVMTDKVWAKKSKKFGRTEYCIQKVIFAKYNGSASYNNCMGSLFGNRFSKKYSGLTKTTAYKW